MGVAFRTMVAATSCAVIVTGAAGSAYAEGVDIAILRASPIGRVAPKVLDAVDGALEGLVLTQPDLKAVVGDDLKTRLHADPRAAVRACGTELACVARLGRRAGVAQVLWVRVKSKGGGVRLALFIVGVADRKIQQSTVIELETLTDLDMAIEPRLRELFAERVVPPTEGALADPLAMLELEPMPELAPVAPPDFGPEPAKKATPVETVVAEPAPTTPAPPFRAEAGSSGGVALAAPSSKVVTRSGWRPLRWLGWGLAGASAAVFGVSGYYGTQYRSAVNEIDAEGPRTTSLPRAIELQREANVARDRVHISALIGGAVAGAALTLLLIDGLDIVTWRVGVDGSSAEAVVAFAW